MNKHFEYPDFFARFYDLIYHQVRDSVDYTYFLSKIAAEKGKILEVGVGTGRLFTEGLRQGADLYGIDISASMIEKLLSKIPEHEHYRIKIGDAVRMKWDFKFNLIIAPFRVFSHILEIDDQLTLLNNIYYHLNHGGEFIFDLFVPDPHLLANGIENYTDFTGEYEPGKEIKRITSSKPDIVNQLLDVTMKFVWDEDGKPVEKEWQMKMRFYFRYELEHLISRSKLKLKTIYGDYAGNPLNSGSKDFILHCYKA
jgi:SAM-dependent methyltransferase